MLWNKKFQHAELKCPRCKAVMKKIKHPTGAVLDVCPSCGGMWLDRDEVALLYKAQHPEPKAKKSAKKKSNK